MNALICSQQARRARYLLPVFFICFAMMAGFWLPTGFAQAAQNSNKRIQITMSAGSPIITDTSGYTASFTLSNTSDDNLTEGKLNLLTSPRSFNSAKSMQNWAESSVRTPTPLLLGKIKVPALPKGASTRVKITCKADDPVLKKFSTWGAKPLLAQYLATTESGTKIEERLHSYVTRSHDQLNEASTPKLTITTTLPLTSAERTLTKNGLDNLITDPAASVNVSEASEASIKTINALTKLAATHSSLNVVADPNILYTASGLKQASLSGIMQPYGTDIAARAAVAEDLWTKAGIPNDAWNAQEAHRRAELAENRSPDPESNTAKALETSKLPAIAWEGKYSWDDASLALARKQGYTAVVSESAQHDTSSNVVSGRERVSTNNGDLTVLVAEQTLSTLAQGKASSSSAQAENTQAGRTARFVAQSALYQMQQPYVARNLLVSLGTSPSPEDATADLAALEKSDWINMGDLPTLLKQAQGDTSANPADTAADVDPHSSIFTLTTRAPSSEERDAIKSTLGTLSTTTETLERLKSQILTAATVSKDLSSNKSRNPQALSHQNAKPGDADAVTALQWLEKLHAVHQNLGMLMFAPSQAVRTTMASANTSFNTGLNNSISVVPPSKVNVFSEKAQTPITVKNRLPYPISIRVHAATNSNAISITQVKEIEVKASTEEQATFDITVVGAGSATITFTPTDRANVAFGKAPSTQVYSQLTLSDMSGNILIILALLLGAVGIYRQARRRKDSDK